MYIYIYIYNTLNGSDRQKYTDSQNSSFCSWTNFPLAVVRVLLDLCSLLDPHACLDILSGQSIGVLQFWCAHVVCVFGCATLVVTLPVWFSWFYFGSGVCCSGFRVDVLCGRLRLSLVWLFLWFAIRCPCPKVCYCGVDVYFLQTLLSLSMSGWFCCLACVCF